MRRTALIGLWVAATAATTAMAYWVVDAAGSTVNDRPLTVVAAGETTTAASATTSDLSTIPPDTSSAATVSTTIRSGPITTSATNPVVTSPTTATTSTPNTTSTTEVEWQSKTINSAGGSVFISYRAGEVRMESVVPLAGFNYEIDDDGPDEVRVYFSGGEIESEIRVRWENGALVTEVDENP